VSLCVAYGQEVLSLGELLASRGVAASSVIRFVDVLQVGLFMISYLFL